MSILDSKLEPEGALTFKFIVPGTRIFARYEAERTTETKLNPSARILDCVILESRVVDDYGKEKTGPTGAFSIFESKGMETALHQAQLDQGDEFILQFHSVGTSGFKKFVCKKVDHHESKASTKAVRPQVKTSAA
jgi:hypothetical protein